MYIYIHIYIYTHVQFCYLGVAVSTWKDCINLAFFALITPIG